MLRESRVFCGRKSIYIFMCPAKLFDILKVNNALLLGHDVRRLQTCFNL